MKIAEYLLEGLTAEAKILPLEYGRASLHDAEKLRALRAEYKRVDAEKRKTKDAAKRAALSTRRKELVAEIAELRRNKSKTRKARGKLTSEIRKLKKRASRAWARMHAWEKKLAKVERSLPFATAHGGPLRKKDDRTKLTGRYKALGKRVPWDSFMVEKPAETE